MIGDESSYSLPARSMSNPHLSIWPQPDTYGGGANWTGSNAEVHHNSGIMNHWFYILSVGKSGINGIGNAYNVTGIGISKAEKIAYRSLTVYMTSGTNFANARTHAIQAATDLYGVCSREMMSVTNAWHAVGVGSQYTMSVVNFTNQPPVSTNKTVENNCGDINIQNVTVTSGATLTLKAAGNINVQDVTVNNNSKLILDAVGKVNIGINFKVELGSIWKIIK